MYELLVSYINWIFGLFDFEWFRYLFVMPSIFAIFFITLDLIKPMGLFHQRGVSL